MALAQSTKRVQDTAAMTRRVRQRLPLVWRTWSEGDIDAYKVRKIDHALRRLRHEGSVPVLDRRVVEVAGDKTPQQLQTWLNRFVAHAEPGEDEVRHQRAFDDRSVQVFQELDGMGWISGAGTAPDVAAFDAMLTGRARALGADDPRSMDQRRADIYMDILMGRTPNGYDPPAGTGEATGEAGTGGNRTGDAGANASPSPSPVVGVTVPIQSLLGIDETPGDLFDRSNTVPASVVRELARRPGTLFYRLLTDARGYLLDVTELGRFPSELLSVGIKVRGGTDCWPVGSRSAAWCDDEHHTPHPRGPTAASNMGPMARRSHRAKTHAKFRCRRAGPDEPAGPSVKWTTPTGHRYTVADEPLPVGRWTDPAEPAGDTARAAAWPPDFYHQHDWIPETDIRNAIACQDGLDDDLAAEVAEALAT